MNQDVFHIDEDSAFKEIIKQDKMYHIACKVWFTASCIPLPLSFQFEGDDNIIQAVKDITVKSCEDKNYSGIRSKEYGCEAIIGGIRLQIKLIYYMEACKWVMILPL
jgi:hypothetical protein